MGKRVVPAEQLLAGPFRGRDAVARGLVTRHMLGGPSWRRLLLDTYAAVGTPLDHRTWCAAVALNLSGGSAIDRYSAAYLHGVDQLFPDAPVSITVPKRTHLWRNAEEVRTFRTVLDPSDVVTLDGMPVTTTLRTAFDLGRQPQLGPALEALDALCHRHLVSVAQLAEYAHVHRHLRNGALLLRRLPLVEPRAESPMESRMRLLFVTAGLPVPVAQHEVRDRHDRFVGRLDLAWPRRRLAAEYDGDLHREQLRFRRDVARLNALHEAGWTVLRFTAPDLIDHPEETVRQVAAALGHRQAA